MSGNHHRRETIQISLGSTANAVTSHLLNLQGLAATSSSATDEDDPINKYVTHTVYKETLVPRVLMIDQGNQFRRSSTTTTTSSSILHQNTPAEIPSSSSAAALGIQSWSGTVETQHVATSKEQLNDSSALPFSYETAHDLSQQLVSSSYSNYHVAKREASSAAAAFASQTGRHVDWDDEGEEEEEEDDYERERRLELERSRWTHQTKPSIEDQLSNFWMGVKDQQDSLLEEDKENPTGVGEPSSLSPSSLTPDYSPRWIDYLMPPYPPRKSNVPLPFASNGDNNRIVETWDSYVMGSSSGEIQNNWKDDALFDSLRHQLEDCDSVQGVSILTEAHGIYAGLASSLLLELQDECPSAGRLVYHVVDPASTATNEDSDDGWQPKHVKLVRSWIENGLTLHDLTTNAHAVLPLSIERVFRQNHQTTLPQTGRPPPFGMFQATGRLAMALETSTLAYRVNGSSNNNNTTIGLAGGRYGGASVAAGGYGTASHLSFGEYLATLQPESRYSVLELDVLGDASANDASTLATAFVQGTSLERDHRIKSNRVASRPRDVLPGAWLERRRRGGDGLLEAASPARDIKATQQDYNFALTTSLRPSMNWDSFLPCAMEGMWRRYRPHVAMGIVAQESVQQLTTTNGGGAGSYWKPLLFRNDTDDYSPTSLAVVRNSTRSYDHLDVIASNMKRALQPKFRGYHNRDVLKNVLPDSDDCTEAMDGCWNLRDVYEPPDGGGENEEGTYFANDAV